MSSRPETEVHIGIDVSSTSHHVAFLFPDSSLRDFEIPHNSEGFLRLLSEIKVECQDKGLTPIVGIEGKNGYAAPLDEIIVKRGIKLYNINNLSLNRFRQLYGAPFKNDKHDARLIATFLKSRNMLSVAGKSPLHEITKTDQITSRIRLLSRSQSDLIKEKTRKINQLTKLIRGYFPEFLEIKKKISSPWQFIVLRDYPDIKRLNRAKLEAIASLKDRRMKRSIGIKKAKRVKDAIGKVAFIPEYSDSLAQLVSALAESILDLHLRIISIDKSLDVLGTQHKEIVALRRFKGIGIKTCSRFLGEIGTIRRFKNHDSLALYCGVACIDNKSGKMNFTYNHKQINKLAKAALLEISNKRMGYCKTSRGYYDKKRAEGKKHVHALKCLARQFIKVVFKELNSLYSEVSLPIAA